jgi:hypothetical protein
LFRTFYKNKSEFVQGPRIKKTSIVFKLTD